MNSVKIESMADARMVMVELEQFFSRFRQLIETSQPLPTKMDYRGWKIRDALRDYLGHVSCEVSEDVLVDVMRESGVVAGKFAEKNVKIAVAMNDASHLKEPIFYREDGKVGLVSWKQEKAA